ncbi:hypothetical protein AOT82_1914 [Psychrobacter sp. AntiMn-1]|nr:hypothetical protein AOT82_1914 [Psychrobacter sp. AntiMn-1]
MCLIEHAKGLVMVIPTLQIEIILNVCMGIFKQIFNMNKNDINLL